MYTHNYTDEHIINIKEKHGKIIDFDFYPDEFGIWRKTDDLISSENLPIKYLSDKQFFFLWRTEPNYKWHLFQAAANLTKGQIDRYREFYEAGDDEVVEMIDDQAEAISTVNNAWGKTFTEELDELILSKE